MQAQELLREMQKLDKSGLIQLLGISDKLADQNLAWLKTYPEQPEKPCVVAFDGPAYRALDAGSFTPQQQAAAQVIRMRRKKPAVPSGRPRRPCNRLDLRRGVAVPDYRANIPHQMRRKKPLVRNRLDLRRGVAVRREQRQYPAHREFRSGCVIDRRQLREYPSRRRERQNSSRAKGRCGMLRAPQAHLRIPCGLHGLLRPCDAVRPRRLEMSFV